MVGGRVRSVESAMDFKQIGFFLGLDVRNPRPCSDTMSHSFHFLYIFSIELVTRYIDTRMRF